MARSGPRRRRNRSDDDLPAPSIARCEIHPDTIDGDRVIRKTATGSNREALRREGSVLIQIGSSHVVTLVELVESETTTELITVDAGSRTLADPVKISPLELLRALSNCVRAITELHSDGWEHGSIRAEHVIVGARGRIKLCSMASARRLSTSSTPDSDDDSVRRRRNDVSDLIALIMDVGSGDVGDGTWHERRARVRLNRTIIEAATSARDALRTTGSPTETLTCLQELLKDPSHPARDHQIVGNQRLRRHAIPRPDRHARSTSRPQTTSGHGLQRVHALSAALALIATGIGVFVLGSTTNAGTSSNTGAYVTPERDQRIPTADRRYTAVTSDTAGDPTTTAQTWARPDLEDQQYVSEPTEPSGPSDEPVTTARRSNMIVVDGVGYTAGATGDVAINADWFCTGAQNVLLLRPSTGEVFFFDDWAEPGSPSTGRVIGVYRGAVDVLETSGKCGTASLEMADTNTVDVVIAPKVHDVPKSGMDDE